MQTTEQTTSQPAGATEEIQAALARAVQRGVTPFQIASALNALQKDDDLFLFQHNGDRSVGINGEHAYVQINTQGFSPEDRADFAQALRELLSPVFTELWGFTVTMHPMIQQPNKQEERHAA